MKMKHPTLGTREVPDEAQAVWARAGWVATGTTPAAKPDQEAKAPAKAPTEGSDDPPPKRKRGRPRKTDTTGS